MKTLNYILRSYPALSGMGGRLERLNCRMRLFVCVQTWSNNVTLTLKYVWGMLILTCLLTLSITVLVQQHLDKKDISLRYLLKTVIFTTQTHSVTTSSTPYNPHRTACMEFTACKPSRCKIETRPLHWCQHAKLWRMHLQLGFSRRWSFWLWSCRWRLTIGQNWPQCKGLSHKTHGGLRLVSGTQPFNATTCTLSGSDVRTPRWCHKICKTLSWKYIHSIIIIIIIVSAFFQQTDILLRSQNCIVFKFKRRWLLYLYVVLKSCRNH
jgi:hypothetical protein